MNIPPTDTEHNIYKDVPHWKSGIQIIIETWKQMFSILKTSKQRHHHIKSFTILHWQSQNQMSDIDIFVQFFH